MTDFTVTNGRASQYPARHYGAHFAGNRATFCLEQDLSSFDANVQAIPSLPVVSLKTTPVVASELFFGGSVKHRANDGQSEFSMSTTRSHDLENGKARWQYIETSDNVWDFTDLDAWVDSHYAAGRDLIFTLFGTPAWASARPTEEGAYGSFSLGIQAEPSDMTKWDRFCTTIATRYLGKIKYYEVWNEPNYNNDGTGVTAQGLSNKVFYFSGTFAKLSEMVRRANQAIKAVDPTAKIISPALTTWSATAGGAAETYLTGMMAASSGDAGNTPMKNWIDIVGVHLYEAGNTLINVPKMIDRVKAGMATAGVSDKEIWDTESAPIAPDVVSMTTNAASLFIARSMIAQAAKGVARTVYYQYDNATMGIKDTSIVRYREWIKSLLTSGEILAACVFSDNRVGCLTNNGLLVI